jgi:hypothetical protein
VLANLALIHEYIATGGGVLFEASATGFGEFYSIARNEVLGRYGLTFYPQGLRDDAEFVGVTGKKNTPGCEHLNGVYARGVLRSCGGRPYSSR